MYGIEIRYKNGDIYYFGKGANDFIDFNLTLGKRVSINKDDNEEYYCVANLDPDLIEKYGYKTLHSAKQGLSSRYIKAFIKEGSEHNNLVSVKIVELTTSMETRMNWSELTNALNAYHS